MTRIRFFPFVVLVAIGGAAGCGPKRTVAATQPSPAAFNEATSEAPALKVVDAGIAALGGYDKWTAIKELKFDVKFLLDGQMKAYYRHAWDRWNGRHHQEVANLSSAAKPEEIRWTVVMHDLFDLERKPHVTYGGSPVAAAEAREASKLARQRLAEDAYLLAVFYKLRDPGVRLSDAGEAKDVKGACVPSCRTVKITFDPTVGTETWFVNFNTESKLPELIEKLHGQGRIGYRIKGWQDAGGLKWPTELQNIGLEGEVIKYENIQVGEPEEATYMPSVEG